MMLTLAELDARCLLSASPFPDAPSVPYTVAYLRDGGLIAAAGDGGGPRVVRQDATGGEVWSVYVADPQTRQGVPAESFRLLLQAGADVLQVARVTPTPADLDPLANAIDSTAGVLTRTELGPNLEIVPGGPTPFGVGLVYARSPADADEATRRQQLPRLVLGELGSPDYYVASGSSVALARSLGKYFEIDADDLSAGAIAQNVRAKA